MLGSADWRSLRIAVTRRHVRVTWEGDDVFVVTRAELDEYARVLARNPPVAGVELSLPASGGIGLYVNKSGASFRNVRIIPSASN